MGLDSSRRRKARNLTAIIRSLAGAVNAKDRTMIALTRLAAATVAAVAMNAAPVSADTITVFDVEGTVIDVSQDYGLYGINNFSGTLTVDAETPGVYGCPGGCRVAVAAVDITFPGIDPFKYIWTSESSLVVATDEPYPPGPTNISCISTFSPNRNPTS
jgi:hypothetical protein